MSRTPLSQTLLDPSIRWSPPAAAARRNSFHVVIRPAAGEGNLPKRKGPSAFDEGLRSRPWAMPEGFWFRLYNRARRRASKRRLPRHRLPVALTCPTF